MSRFSETKSSQDAWRVDVDAWFSFYVRACARERLCEITFLPPEGEKHRHVFACLFSSFSLPPFSFSFFFFLTSLIPQLPLCG